MRGLECGVWGLGFGVWVWDYLRCDCHWPYREAALRLNVVRVAANAFRDLARDLRQCWCCGEGEGKEEGECDAHDVHADEWRKGC